jgi:hypothetical protein
MSLTKTYHWLVEVLKATEHATDGGKPVQS